MSPAELFDHLVSGEKVKIRFLSNEDKRKLQSALGNAKLRASKKLGDFDTLKDKVILFSPIDGEKETYEITLTSKPRRSESYEIITKEN